MKTRYLICKNKKQIKKLIQCCKETKVASVDFETTGTLLFNSNFYPTILTVTYQAGSAVIIPLGHPDSPMRESWLRNLRYFGRQVIENPEITKVAWNWKFDNKVFQKYGIYSRGTVIDAMLAKYLLNEERPHGLKQMVNRYLPEFSGYEKSDNFDELPWDRKPFKALCRYGSIDTDATYRLAVFLENKLIQHGFYQTYRNLIMPASKVLQSAEFRGLNIDVELNTSLHIKYEKLIQDAIDDLRQMPIMKTYAVKALQAKKEIYISAIEAEIEELEKKNGDGSKNRQIKSREQKIISFASGNFSNKKEKALLEPFNFKSVKQLVDLIYISPYGLKYPIIAYTKDQKTKRSSQTPSTSEDTLIALLPEDKHGFINKLLTLRGYEHTYSTFISGYKEKIQDDRKMHPSFNIHGTVTGRLSSSDPNAQQIPKKEVNPDIKKQFITPPGMLFLAYDYSQAELRIMAHLSGDEVLLDAFASGKDPHLAIACQKYGENYDEILPIYLDETHPRYKEWKVKRKQAKQIVFGTIYGIEAKKLSSQLSDPKTGLVVTPEEAQAFLDEFFHEHPKVKKFINKQANRMKKKGYVETLFGRRRRCPKVYSENYGEYLEALRQSVNAPCQSAGSDMALFASVIIYTEMKKGNLPFIPEVSTVHDSIYNYSLPEFINPWTIYQFHCICKNPDTKTYFGFKIDDVDMDMDFSIGRNMIEEYPYTPGYDYSKMLSPDFTEEEYFAEHRKTKHIPVSEYPKAFPEYFTEEFLTSFKNTWTKKFNKLPLIF